MVIVVWRWRRGWRGPGRPMKHRFIGVEPVRMEFGPFPKGRDKDPIYMSIDEYEAYRLIYYLGYTQEEAAKHMGVSRGTLWRLLASARRKIAVMLVERRPLIISP
jgi:hypothetical protein